MNVEGAEEEEDREIGERIQFIIQLQPVCGAVLDRDCCFVGMRRPPNELYARLIVSFVVK